MKFKRALFGLASAAVVVAPVATVVSCGSTGIKWEGNHVDKNEDISFITDGGSITDHSFNEGGLKGVTNYSTTSGKTYAVYQTANEGSNDSDYQTQYTAALNSSQNSTFVVSGFNHSKWANTTKPDGSGQRIEYFSDQHKDKNIVAIDIADTDASNHFYGLTFRTEQSGFLAGYQLGFQLNKLLKGATSPYKVATFGGQNITAVTDYMVGFVEGVKYFNANKPANSTEMTLLNGTNTLPYSSSFSNSFLVGKGRSLADSLLSAGAVAIFPVAGPQTADVDEAIRASGKLGKAFAVGVDTDQSKVYGDTIIGSAMKGLTDATSDTLAKIFGATNTASDKTYALGDNVDGKKFVGYTQSSIKTDYQTEIPADGESAAETYAKVAANFETTSHDTGWALSSLPKAPVQP